MRLFNIKNLSCFVAGPPDETTVGYSPPSGALDGSELSIFVEDLLLAWLIDLEMLMVLGIDPVGAGWPVVPSISLFRSLLTSRTDWNLDSCRLS